jgi:peptidoglycan/LPS O-acetylase OafA/YrhL
MNEPADPTRPTPRSSHFRALDGVRGLAILMVIAYHAVGATLYPDVLLGWLRPLLMSGWAGVDLFFALSGFLITTLLLREEDRERLAGRPARFSLSRFYLRRALRILPAFATVLALNVLVFSRLAPSAGLDEIERSRFGLWPYGTFWANYIIAYGPRWLGHAFAQGRDAYAITWSLCVEEHFYLLWPFFLFLCKGARPRVAVSAAVCLLLPIMRHLAVGLDWDTRLAVHFASHYRLDSILWGALAALLAEHLTWADRTRRLALAGGLAVVVVLAATNTMTVQPTAKALGFSLGFSALAITGALLLLELVHRPGTWLGRLFEFRPLVAVGRVSYGMYLLHLPMMDLAMRILFAVPRRPTLANLGMAIVFFWGVSFAAAQVLYLVVEKRFLALKDRVSRSNAQVPGSDGTAINAPWKP